ncbi:MAG: sugar transferase [Candidatus Angelobacter sp.]
MNLYAKREMPRKTSVATSEERPLARALPVRRKEKKAARVTQAQTKKNQSVAFAAMIDLILMVGICAVYLFSFDISISEAISRVDLRGLVLHQVMIIVIYSFLMLPCAHYYGLYRHYLPILETALAALKTGMTATAGMAALFYLSGTGRSARSNLLVIAGCATLALTGRHVLLRVRARRTRIRDEQMTNVLIVGAGKVGMDLAQNLKLSPGHRVIGFLDDLRGDARVLGSSNDLAEIARRYFIDEVMVTIPSQRDLVKKIVLEARKLRLDVKVVPELYDGIAANAPVEYVAHLPVSVLHREPIRATGLKLKRICDVLLCSLMLVVTAPAFLLIAVLLKLESPGPVFYRSHRVGKKGRIFTFYKFRTMVTGADGLRTTLEQLNERSAILFKIAHDPRITRVGRILRKFSLDEAPQLINVLKGDMSLVGPRPPLPSEFKQYRLDHLRRLDVVPGITGLWQITSRQDPSFDNYIALDLEYIENWSLGLDLKILLRTIPAVLKGTGI